MNQHSPQILGKSFSAMTTAELEDLLQAEMDSDHDIDIEKVKAIAAVLNERTEDEIDVDAAWDSFVHNHLPYETIYQHNNPMTETTSISKQSSKEFRKHGKSIKRRAFRIGLIAAILVVILSVTATSIHFEFWNVILQRSSETFGFSFGEENIIERNPEYADLYEQLIHDGVSEKMIPCYLPEGYTQTEFYSDGKQYVAVYSHNDQEITIQIRKVPRNSGRQFEMDSNSDELYTSGGIDHIISTNMGNYRAVWINGEYECSIIMINNPSKEALYLMIDSIYMEG